MRLRPLPTTAQYRRDTACRCAIVGDRGAGARAPATSRRGASAATRGTRGHAPDRACVDLIGDGDGEEVARGDLRVERLGGRHCHLDVAAVGRVEHAVGLVDEVAVAPVDDGDDRSTAARARSDVRLVSVVVPALADRDDERVGHVVARAGTRELGRDHSFGAHRVVGEAGEDRGQALTRDRRGALADHHDALDGAVAQALPYRVRQRLGRRARPTRRPSRSTILPRSVLRNDAGASDDLLQEEVREVAAVDVAGRDLGVLELVGVDRERRAVEGEPVGCRRGCPPGRRRASRPGRGVAAARSGSRGRLAVHAQVGRVSSTTPYGSLATTYASSTRPT